MDTEKNKRLQVCYQFTLNSHTTIIALLARFYQLSMGVFYCKIFFKPVNLLALNTLEDNLLKISDNH